MTDTTAPSTTDKTPVHVVLRLTPAGRGTLILNGQDLSHRCKRVSVTTEAMKYTEVTLILRVDEIDIEADAYQEERE